MKQQYTNMYMQDEKNKLINAYLNPSIYIYIYIYIYMYIQRYEKNKWRDEKALVDFSLIKGIFFEFSDTKQKGNRIKERKMLLTSESSFTPRIFAPHSHVPFDHAKFTKQNPYQSIINHYQPFRVLCNLSFFLYIYIYIF